MLGECRRRLVWWWLALAGLATFLFVALRIRSEWWVMVVSSKAGSARESAATPSVGREVDRVALVSLRADGSPDQSDGFEQIALED